MSELLGNKSQLFATIDQQQITVIKGSITQKINQSYSGAFTITTDGQMKPDAMLGKKIIIAMHSSDQTHYVHGIVTQSTSSAGEYHTFNVSIASPLTLMARRHQSRSFTASTLKSILKEVLSDKAFHPAEIIFKLNEDVEHAYYEQHQTTDLAFFHRVIAEEGLSYYFLPSQSHVAICIDDASEKVARPSAGTFPFKPDLQASNALYKVDSFYRACAPCVKGVQLHGYDALAPSMSMQASSSMPALSLMELKPSNDAQLKKTQQYRLDALNAQSDTATLTCNIPSLIPGIVFVLSEHPEAVHNRHYRVIESIQSWDESGNDLRYVNEIRVVPVTASLRPSYEPLNHVVPHLSLAVVKGEGIRAHLTEKGEYVVQPLDMAASDTPSAPVRQAQSFVGNDYGMHFPLLDNTEVIMARVNGHPDKPVILGALYNETNVNPVGGTNPYLNVIKTQSGNALVMNDTPDRRGIVLQTAQDENQLILDANKHTPDIQLSSMKGGFNLQAAGASAWSTQGDALLTAAENMDIRAKAMTLATTAAHMSFASAGNVLLSGKELAVNVVEGVTSTVGGSFWHNVTGDHDVLCEGKFTLTSEAGGVHIQSSSGAVVMLAEKGNITFEVGESAVEFDVSGNCVLRANKITLHAAEINMQQSAAVSVG